MIDKYKGYEQYRPDYNQIKKDVEAEIGVKTIITKSFKEYENTINKLVDNGYSCGKDYMTETRLYNGLQIVKVVLKEA